MKSGASVVDNRQLAVVMFLDMVSYSARMSREEATALAHVADLEAILKENVPAFGGRLVKFMGDGSMSYFPTAESAVSCALQLLETIRERNGRFPPRQQFSVRVGLHLGDVVHKGSDLFGSAVNVAARIQPCADPGGVAMSGIVYSQVRNKIPLTGVFLPPVKLKNIPEDIPIYLTAPLEKNIFFWKLGKRRRVWEWVFLGLTVCLMGGSVGFFHILAAPRHWALAGVLTSQDENSRKAAEAVRLRTEMDFSGITGVQWLAPETVLGIFRQRGIPDPAQAVEKMDLAACHAAWQAGLNYLVLFQLGSQGPGWWKLDCYIFNVSGRVRVASFTAEGAELGPLVGKLKRQTQSWIDRNNG